MKVWVVEQFFLSAPDGIFGVFSSKVKADEAVVQLDDTAAKGGPSALAFYEVREYEVDEYHRTA